MGDRLHARIEAERDACVALARDLIAYPTINPPGEAYEPCIRFIGERLAARGFDVRAIRAEGTPGDSDRYPRTNVIARREGADAGADGPLQRPCRRRRGRHGLDGRSVRGRHPRRLPLRPWRVRHEGRAGRRHHRRRVLRCRAPAPSGRGRDQRHGGRGVGRLRRGGASGAHRPARPPPRRPRHHPRAAERRSGVPGPSRRVVGGDRDARVDRARLHAVPGRLRGAPHGRGAGAVRARSVARPRRAPHRHAGRAGRRGGGHHERERHPRRRRRAP